MGGGTDVLVLSGVEDVESDHVDLGVTVLSGLGGGHLHDLAGPVLDHDESVLAEGRALHGEGGGGAGLSGAEIIFIRHYE